MSPHRRVLFRSPLPITVHHIPIPPDISIPRVNAMAGDTTASWSLLLWNNFLTNKINTQIFFFFFQNWVRFWGERYFECVFFWLFFFSWSNKRTTHVLWPKKEVLTLQIRMVWKMVTDTDTYPLTFLSHWFLVGGIFSKCPANTLLSILVKLRWWTRSLGSSYCKWCKAVATWWER